MKRIFKNICILVFALFLNFSTSLKSNAISALSPFSLMLSPYVGLDFLLGGNFTRGFHTANQESFFNGLYQFYNMQFNLGLRVHRNFGFEFFVSRWNYKISPEGENPLSNFKTDNFGLTLNVYLQMPYTELLESIGTNLELYGLIGFGVLNGKTTGLTNSASFHQIAAKFGGGIQLRILGFASVKVGVDYYYLSVPNDKINLGGIMFYNLGFNFYF